MKRRLGLRLAATTVLAAILGIATVLTITGSTVAPAKSTSPKQTQHIGPKEVGFQEQGALNGSTVSRMNQSKAGNFSSSENFKINSEFVPHWSDPEHDDASLENRSESISDDRFESFPLRKWGILASDEQ